MKKKSLIAFFILIIIIAGLYIIITENLPSSEEVKEITEETTTKPPKRTYEIKKVEETEDWVAFSSPGPRPSAITWDGEHIWTYDLQETMFFKHDPDTLEVIEAYDDFLEGMDGGESYGMTFDGRYLWRMRYAHLEAFNISNFSKPVIAYTGDEPFGDEIKVKGVFDHMRSVFWHNGTIYTVLQSGGILQHNPDNYAEYREIGALTTSVGGLASDGKYVWYGDRATGWLYKLNFTSQDVYISDDSVSEVYSLPSTPADIAVGGGYFWLVDDTRGRIYRISNPSVSPLDKMDIVIEDKEYNLINKNIDQDMVWDKSKPYLLEGKVKILKDVELKITPGTKVFFQEGAKLIVEGTLIVEGSRDELVLFTHAKPFQLWQGIEFLPSSIGSIKYAQIQYASFGINSTLPSLRVEYSIVRRIINIGILYAINKDFREINIIGNRVEDIGQDTIKLTLGLGGGSRPKGEKILIQGNNLYHSGGSAILIEGYWAKSEVKNNIVGFHHYQPIQVLAKEAIVLGNYLYGSTAGISAYSPKVSITNNYIHTTGRDGISLLKESFGVVIKEVEVKGNTLDNCYLLIELGKANFNNFLIDVEGHRGTDPPPLWAVHPVLESGKIDLTHNWWNTTDLNEVLRHINGYEKVIINPILKEPYEVGFVYGEGDPVSIVRIDNIEITTAIDGSFFVSLTSGSYNIKMSRDGFNQSFRVDIKGGELTILSVYTSKIQTLKLIFGMMPSFPSILLIYTLILTNYCRNEPLNSVTKRGLRLHSSSPHLLTII